MSNSGNTTLNSNNGQISPQHAENSLPSNSLNQNESLIKIESNSSSSLLEINNSMSTPPPPPPPPPSSLQLPTTLSNSNGYIPQLAFGNLYIQS